MKELIKQYLDHGMSRRQFTTALGALGMSTAAVKAVAQSLETFGQGSPPAAAMREMKGTGGALFVQQLKAAGVEHVFFNPSTGDYPIFDALVDEPAIHLIKGIHEGAVVAMADGYARASGKTGVVIVANIGLPNAMTQMVNSWKDQIPVLVAVASVEQDALGRDLFQESDHCEVMTQPITKWYWAAKTTASIPETVRRGMKFASTSPCGPVFLSLPTNVLRGQASAAIWDQAKFDVPMRIRPDKDDIAKAARMLLEAKNPLMSVGDEASWCRAGNELIELAELLGLPVTGQGGSLGFWSKPFPTRHPLYIGPQLRDMRYPGKPDVLLNLGNRYGERPAPGTQLISIRLDPTSLARGAPVDLAMVADIRLATADLIAAIRSLATPARLKEIAEGRTGPTRAYHADMLEFRQNIARENAQRTPVSLERIGLELEGTLEKDTCYVCDVDSGKTIDPLLSFGGADKHYMGTGPNVLGWGLAAAFGAKLARPVVSVVGDGSFCFSGPQPLWTQARYKAPVINIVLNNHSYNNERNRIWHFGGRQFQSGRDMTCYLGSPDIDYAKTRVGLLQYPFVPAKAGTQDHGPRPLDSRFRGNERRGVRALTLAGTLAALLLSAAPLHAQTAASLPQGEGRDLVATACSQCHTLSVIMAGRDGPVGWKRHVYNMVLRGAQLTPREADTVISYLVTNFGPVAPAANAAALPGGAGKELVESRCVACHSLERVTVVKRQKRDWERVVANMYERWGMAAPDEVNAISAYLVAQFGRD